jgi:hypothetical protein
MSVQIMKHNEVAIVQVPASWTIRDIRLEQSRVHRWCLKQQIPAKIVVVGGGAEDSQPLASVIGTFEETAAAVAAETALVS